MFSTKENINIFISYRRADTAGHTGRLYDRLNHHFGGQAKLFMDLDSIAPGADFVATIESAVGSCNIVIAMIGDQWLAVKDAGGIPRLHHPEDLVRAEIATALKRNILVIPVLVEGAPMPQAKDLPPELARLVRLNALEISDSRWEHDTQRLIGRLEQELGVRQLAPPAQTNPPRPFWKRPWVIGAAGVALLCLVLLGKGCFRQTSPGMTSSASPTPAGTAGPANNGAGKSPAAPPLSPPAASVAGNAAAVSSQSNAVNLLTEENGGKMLIASTDRWKNTIDGKEGSHSYLQNGDFAVFGFKGDKPAALQSLAVYVPETSARNVNGLELLTSNESPEGKFESLGQFQLKNYRVVEDPFQKIALPAVKAKYVKIVILSNQENSNGGVYLFEMRLLGRLD